MADLAHTVRSADLGLADELEALERSSRRRSLPPAEAGAGADFTSNDYLSLARDPRLAEAAKGAIDAHGTGGRASRLLAGGAAVHTELEREAAHWLDSEAALLFPSGYQANLGLLGAVATRGDAVFSDALNHASLVDGARLSRARTHVFPHRDVEALRAQLERERGARRRIVVTESIFSMDGDLAPLEALGALCAEHDAWLIVDEAHAAGLLGVAGAGACAAQGRPPERLLARVVTGGKSLGATGAVVAGSRELVDTLVNRARAFLFTTAAAPPVAGALLAAVRILREDSEAIRAARETALSSARQVAAELGLPAPDGAIVPFPVGDDARALELAATLASHGLDVRAVRPPTVPEGTSRLRIVCHAHNTAAEVEELTRRLAPHVTATPAPRPPGATCLFVTGTDTDVGKTVVSALLTRAALRLGPARYFKPVQTGDDSDTASVARLADIPDALTLRPAFHFTLPASPHEAAAAAGRAIPPGALEASLAGLLRTLDSERIVVELAGGLCVPLRTGFTQLDWMANASPPFVLVARSGLGTLNHTLLSLEALRARNLEPRALFLVGDPHPSNRETLRAMGRVGAIFEVPRFEALDGATLDAWLDGNPLEEVLR